MIKPTQDRVLVKVIPNSDMSEGGIYKGMATTTFAQDRDKAVQQTVGRVVAVGEGKYNARGKRRPPDAPIGSIVSFSDTCGVKIDDDHLMIKEASIAFFMDEPASVELQYEN